MKQNTSDAVIGGLTLVACALLVWLLSGLHGVVYIALAIVVGAIVLHLFERPSPWSKLLAILLLPALLLTYLKPRSTRQGHKAPGPP